MMSNDNDKLVSLMERVAEELKATEPNCHVHTITVTLDGRSSSGVSAKIEFDIDRDDLLDHGTPIILT